MNRIACNLRNSRLLKIFLVQALVCLCISLTLQGGSIYCGSSSCLNLSPELSETDSLTLVNADWGWTDLGGGAKAGQANVMIFDSQQCISAAIVPASAFKTCFAGYSGAHCTTTDSIGIREGALVAMNGSYFDMKELVPVTLYSIGHHIEARTSVKEIYRVDGVIAFKRRNGRCAEIMPCDTSEYDDICRKYHSVIAAGPVLLRNGKYREFADDKGFTLKRHPRTVFGTDRDGNYWFIVIDGRFPGLGEGMTIPETAALARYLGLSDAINLDGGGSSTLWTSKTGVLNHPYDNRRFDHGGLRRVPNAIVVK